MGRSPREGKGYPLQYSGLGNSRDYVHGVAKSRTRLSDFHFHFTSPHGRSARIPGMQQRRDSNTLLRRSFWVGIPSVLRVQAPTTARAVPFTLWNCSGTRGPECQSASGTVWVSREPWYAWPSQPCPGNTGVSAGEGRGSGACSFISHMLGIVQSLRVSGEQCGQALEEAGALSNEAIIPNWPRQAHGASAATQTLSSKGNKS